MTVTRPESPLSRALPALSCRAQSLPNQGPHLRLWLDPPKWERYSQPPHSPLRTAQGMRQYANYLDAAPPVRQVNYQNQGWGDHFLCSLALIPEALLPLPEAHAFPQLNDGDGPLKNFSAPGYLQTILALDPVFFFFFGGGPSKIDSSALRPMSAK